MHSARGRKKQALPSKDAITHQGCHCTAVCRDEPLDLSLSPTGHPLLSAAAVGNRNWTLAATDTVSGESLTVASFRVAVVPCLDDDCGTGQCTTDGNGRLTGSCTCDAFHEGPRCASKRFFVRWTYGNGAVTDPGVVAVAVAGKDFVGETPNVVAFRGRQPRQVQPTTWRFQPESYQQDSDVQLTGMPPGLTMDLTSGAIRGTPRSAGEVPALTPRSRGGLWCLAACMRPCVCDGAAKMGAGSFLEDKLVACRQALTCHLMCLPD